MPSAILSEIRDLLPNTVYLTFNQPEKNEYHRGIFITSAGTGDKAQPSGTLFHAVFADNIWGLERRSVTNICTSKSLVLMWRVASVNGCFGIDRVEEILQQVPCRADKNTDNEEEGRAYLTLSEIEEKGGFSCVPWTENALVALRDEGIINVSGEIRAIVKEARAQAGPEDARLMVGKDFGGLRVVN